MAMTLAQNPKTHSFSTAQPISVCPPSVKKRNVHPFKADGHANSTFHAMHMIIADRKKRTAEEVARIIRSEYHHRAASGYVRDLAAHLRAEWSQYII